MRILALTAACGGFVFGLIAAYYWWLASRVETIPMWGDVEPGDQSLSQAGLIGGMMNAASESARLNQRASVLTAVAVILTTASKAVPSEVVKAAYDDTASPAMKELGKLGQDLVKTVRWVLSPLQFGAARQDRLAKHLERSIELVPEERRVAPVESLALPIAEQLTFHDETSVVGHMFERLLARAMDRDRVGEAHPAFVQIVSQLAPDEAILIRQIDAARPSAYMRPPKKDGSVLLKDEREALIDASNMSDDQKRQLQHVVVRPEELAQPSLVYTYIEHLVSLGIVSYTNEPWNAEFKGAKGANFDFWFVGLNGLGELFYRACLAEG